MSDDNLQNILFGISIIFSTISLIISTWVIISKV